MNIHLNPRWLMKDQTKTESIENLFGEFLKNKNSKDQKLPKSDEIENNQVKQKDEEELIENNEENPKGKIYMFLFIIHFLVFIERKKKKGGRKPKQIPRPKSEVEKVEIKLSKGKVFEGEELIVESHKGSISFVRIYLIIHRKAERKTF